MLCNRWYGLLGGLSTPILGATSTSGALPLLLYATDYVVQVYTGQWMQWEFTNSLTPAKNADGSYVTTTQKDVTFVDNSAFANLDIAWGYYQTSGPISVHYRFLAEDPTGALPGVITVTNSQGSSFTAVPGPWSNDYSDTITASAGQWATTHGFDLSNILAVSNNNLTLAMTSGANTLNGARVTPPPTNTKPHFEVTINSMCLGSGPNGNISAGWIGITQDLTSGASIQPGNSTAQGASVLLTWNSAIAKVYYNGASHNVTLTGSINPANGDIIVCEADIVANQPAFWYIPLATGIPQPLLVPTTLTSNIPGTWKAFGGLYRSNANGTDQITGNWGGSAFAKTPTSGFAGW